MTETLQAREGIYPVHNESDLAVLVGKPVSVRDVGTSRYEGVQRGNHVFLGRLGDTRAIYLLEVKQGSLRPEEGSVAANREDITAAKIYQESDDGYVHQLLSDRLNEVGI